jgi:hypothetical protein
MQRCPSQVLMRCSAYGVPLYVTETFQKPCCCSSVSLLSTAHVLVRCSVYGVLLYVLALLLTVHVCCSGAGALLRC